ncbi:hypothetical protein NKL07_32880 [Mesorhizobium sp. C280B]|uniref:hypothetical protein n=1 Tax=unclassified Mesorhizobium TaxID=325217 RepID=UPI00041AB0B5|nr:hypothetical protein [Mesorhizobium sp. LSJC280B00]
MYSSIETIRAELIGNDRGGHGTLAQPGFKDISAYPRRCELAPNHDVLETAKSLRIIDRTYRAAQPQLVEITGNGGGRKRMKISRAVGLWTPVAQVIDERLSQRINGKSERTSLGMNGG